MEYHCRCRDCKREYKSTNQLDTDNMGYCSEHKEQRVRIAQSIKTSGTKYVKPTANQQYEEIKRDYNLERKHRTFYV